MLRSHVNLQYEGSRNKFHPGQAEVGTFWAKIYVENCPLLVQNLVCGRIRSETFCPKTKWAVDRSFGILTRSAFHFVLYWAKKKTHADNVVQNSQCSTLVIWCRCICFMERDKDRKEGERECEHKSRSSMLVFYSTSKSMQAGCFQDQFQFLNPTFRVEHSNLLPSQTFYPNSKARP